MNGVEPKPHESGAYCSIWRHPKNAVWNTAVQVRFTGKEWTAQYWHRVSYSASYHDGKYYDWSDLITFDTRSAAEHYAQLVWDMKLYD